MGSGRPGRRVPGVAIAFLLAGTAPALAACPEGRDAYRESQGGLAFEALSDPRLGAVVCYPRTVFRKAGEQGGRIRFVSDDGLAWFTVSREPEGADRSAQAAMDQALAELEAGRAEVTYRRQVGDWFVVTGFHGEQGDRIFYRKTIIGPDGAADTLLIDFPRDQRPFYYDMVERMSWSFRSKG